MTDLINTIILPRLYKMRDSEKLHLSYLKTITDVDVSEFIEQSQEWINKIQNSITEYTNYHENRIH